MLLDVLLAPMVVEKKKKGDERVRNDVVLSFRKWSSSPTPTGICRHASQLGRQTGDPFRI
jgi:hypothetical protein